MHDKTPIPFVDTQLFFFFNSGSHLNMCANVDLGSGENMTAKQWKVTDSWRETKGHDLRRDSETDCVDKCRRSHDACGQF